MTNDGLTILTIGMMMMVGKEENKRISAVSNHNNRREKNTSKKEMENHQSHLMTIGYDDNPKKII